MATRDESHMFSLAALTERTSSPPPAPQRTSSDPDNINLGELAPARSFAAGFGSPLYPLGEPRAASAQVDPNPARATPVVPMLIVGALLAAAGIIATALWSVQTPTPPSSVTAPGAALPPLERLPQPEPQSEPKTEGSREVGARAEPAPPSAAASGPPSSADSASQAERPRRRPRPATKPKPASRVTPQAPRPAGPCAHCSPQDLACNIKCRA